LLFFSGYLFLSVATSLNKKDYPNVILHLSGMLLITGISLLITMIVLSANNKLRKDIDKKCPEYEKIENVYIIKK
jgi:uncharacterized integral membrane protein